MALSPSIIGDRNAVSDLNPALISSDLMEQFGSRTDASQLDVNQLDAKQLRHAFDMFNELSLQLADSYQHLEQRVADLSVELDTVSEQRLVELQQKERLAQRLETLIKGLPGGVVVLDKQGLVVETNPVAESLLQHSLRGALWRDIIKQCFAPREDDGHEVSTRDGKRISIVTRSMAEDGQIILLTDQTETRRLQAELSRNERLSALGRMVSTLAHQVRTPLSSAMLYANHLHDNELERASDENLPINY